tara:strand:- start:2686 stop:2907 length:222 start_codon:yes stop_codon:yes gene_type:complete
MKNKIFAWLVLIAACVVLICGLSLLMAFPFMWMWNYAVVAALTIANPISYWPAFCLMFFIGLFLAKSNSSSSN